MARCTKIVATIGPASQDAQSIESLLTAGVNVARLNFSHGTHEVHAGVIRCLRETALRLQQPLCILQDLQGPKIRTGNLAAGTVEILPGQPLTLTTRPVPGDAEQVTVDFPELPLSVEPGGRILLDDGNLELQVLRVEGEQVFTRVVVGGVLKPHKGINLPGARIPVSALTEKDKEDLTFGLEQGVDAIALSFVRSADDLQALRDEIARLAPDRVDTPCIAKLERPEALDNLEAIVLAADGVMVARGDLGVEMSPESVPAAQKRIIECANLHERLVITATQMLDSMMNNPRPTRAEASDVANAILDGTDAVMLSGETAAGKYPLKAVQMMNAIICEAETHMQRWSHWHGQANPDSPNDDTYFMSMAARALAQDKNVAAIAVFTLTGRTAELMSKSRPGVPILAFTPVSSVYNRMAMFWGVSSHKVKQACSIEEMVAEVEEALLASSQVQKGQQVVITCGYPVGEIRPTNLALLHTVGGEENIDRR
jgi:pyruvate kinase